MKRKIMIAAASIALAIPSPALAGADPWYPGASGRQVGMCEGSDRGPGSGRWPFSWWYPCWVV